MDNPKPTFGDKTIGRSPIERLIKWLDAYNLLKPIINFNILLLLIGMNSSIREESTKGAVFLLIVFLILLSGNEATSNFFGASALAVFIILHISLFGFNSLAIILSFIIFIIFRKNMTKNLLGPISTYLLLDTVIYYFNINIQFEKVFESLGNSIFSYEWFVALSLIPITAFYLKFEKSISAVFKGAFLKKYGVFIALMILIVSFTSIGIIFEIGISFSISSFFLFLYFIGAIHHKDDMKKFYKIILPLLLYLILLILLKKNGIL